MSKQTTLFDKTVAKKPFFSERQVANSTYFWTMNALWQFYLGKDKKEFFSKAQWEWKEKFKGDIDVQSALSERVKKGTCFSSGQQLVPSFFTGPSTEPSTLLLSAAASNETVADDRMVKMTTVASTTSA